ncbi:hypothetical protein [Caenibius sp. WL]|uniref:hypothetical protein n=1 Tax=Caenibius sp. WL TaxID=2872646 RepID=UPI001C9915CA|nr:hypothetical protein [Caenibius sp. WL]QZP07085.1 hypothetical protein K5X80_10225 [Caenibius sp. WL]
MKNYGRSQPAVIVVNGREYLNESLQPSGMHRGMTAEERQALLDRHEERAKLRQAECDLNFLRALELGAKLKALKGEV